MITLESHPKHPIMKALKEIGATWGTAIYIPSFCPTWGWHVESSKGYFWGMNKAHVIKEIRKNEGEFGSMSGYYKCSK